MFGLTGIYLRLAEYAVLIAFLFGCYFWIGNHFVDEYKQKEATAQAIADKVQQDKYNKLASDYETLKLTRASNAITIQKQTERIIERPVYSNQCFDNDGMHVANQAISGASAPVADTKMPSDKTP